MEFGIFNLMGSRTPEKPTAEVFAEVAEQTRLADELGYAIPWFAEAYCSASPNSILLLTEAVARDDAILAFCSWPPGSCADPARSFHVNTVPSRADGADDVRLTFASNGLT